MYVGAIPGWPQTNIKLIIKKETLMISLLPLL